MTLTSSARARIDAMLKKNKEGGFTLLELLLVVAAIAILATIVFAVLSPADTLNKFRDSNRLSNVQAIMNAMSLYAIDNSGNVPDSASWVTASSMTICSVGGGCAIPLADLTTNSKYMIAVPTDPSDSSYYTASIDANGLVTISAPLASTGTIKATGKFNPL